MKKILAIAGSNHSTSINKMLLEFSTQYIKDEVEVMDIQGFDDLPIYNSDWEKEKGIPEKVENFYKKLQQFDAYIVASPEHNGLIPAAFKNLIDWVSRIDMKFFGQKPVLLMSASPGPRGGQNVLSVLSSVLPYWGAQLIGIYSLGSFYQKMDVDNLSLQVEDASKLHGAIDELSYALQQPMAA